MDKEFIRNRVYKIRTAKNISARNLSLELGMSSEYINQLESGKLTPSIDILINFCSYFDITLSEFFDANNNYPTQLKPLIESLSKLDSEQFDIISKLILMITNKK